MPRPSHAGRFVAAFFLPAVLGGCAEAPPAGDRRLVIENVVVVSPGTPRGAPVTVAIAGDRIVAIGSGAQARDGDSVIAGSGRFLTPGLIDGHVHLASPAGLPFDPPPALQPAVAAYFTPLPRSYLYHGFTTVIDLHEFDPAPAWDAIDLVISRGRPIERRSLAMPGQ